ncbi:hypothetical protein ACFE04_016045 [Oxalis oulophora]
MESSLLLATVKEEESMSVNMNPWALHLQKLGSQVTCSLCWKLFKAPRLLPCNHVICSSCLAKFVTFLGIECRICKATCAIKDLRDVPFVENITTIFKNLDAASEKIKLLDDGNNEKQKTPNLGPESDGNLRSSTLGQVSEPNPKSKSFSDASSGKMKCLDNGNDEDPKRQKILNLGPKSDGKLRTSTLRQDSESTPKPILSSGEQLPAVSKDSSANKTKCGFCQSSKISKISGPMVYFAANGEQVEVDKANRSGVLHVHNACIQWTPQVYFVGETIKNLKAELARGSRLKCSKCGLKGAVLGCYVESCRRSYHFPCAQEFSTCRWDYVSANFFHVYLEKYLLLCPAHSSEKFPEEKSGKCSKNHAKPVETTAQEPKFFLASPDEAKKMVFCGSALSSEEKSLLVKFASMIGASVSKLWRSNVTHVIAGTDSNGACTRTFKILMAISNGRWILKIDWIKACMESMQLVAQEPYEVNIDNYGRCDGLKNGRTRVVENAPKIFNGLNFYFAGEFVFDYKDLQSLVTAAGGTVLNSWEELTAQNREELAATARTLVVYNLDLPQGSMSDEELSLFRERLDKAKDLASKVGGQAIGHMWILDSLASYKLLPFVD